MSSVQQVLAVIGALIALAAIAGGIYAAFRTSAQDARLKRVSEERDDYLSRLNYIEPRFAKLEQENKVLLELHNPAEQIRLLAAQEQTNHDRTVELLTDQRDTLSAIKLQLPQRGTG